MLKNGIVVSRLAFFEKSGGCFSKLSLPFFLFFAIIYWILKKYTWIYDKYNEICGYIDVIFNEMYICKGT